ncbi:MAG TPA: decaprenylphospho-beta-D-erythro-pentofuranosid-2-ulose 2-reductase [Acidimicrobiia bacterium]|jgi:decaprenylphospho-beta-D-erythro-pentofuranosid-2-ulose 2-reductase
MQDALGGVQTVLVLGGGSEIAHATLRRLVRHRARTVVLAARRPDELAEVVHELRELGATRVETVAFDATDTAGHEALIDGVVGRVGDLDLVLVAFGLLGDQAEAERDGDAAAEVARVNYLGAVSTGIPLAARLRAQGHGLIVALSTVAGERVRRSNFVYGSSKAGYDGFFQGLGDSLVGSGARVMIVRPGFVSTKMTSGLTPPPLATTPDTVADAIVHGIERGREVIWVPPALRFVMSGLRHVPRALFRKLPV